MWFHLWQKYLWKSLFLNTFKVIFIVESWEDCAEETETQAASETSLVPYRKLEKLQRFQFLI